MGVIGGTGNSIIVEIRTRKRATLKTPLFVNDVTKSKNSMKAVKQEVMGREKSVVQVLLLHWLAKEAHCPVSS